MENLNDNKFLRILKEYSSPIATIGGILLIASLLGFNMNVPNFYKSLDVEAKIILLFSINLIITVVIAVILSNKMSVVDEIE